MVLTNSPKTNSSRVSACFPIFYDGPVDRALLAVQPILSRLGEFAEEHSDFMCRALPDLCRWALHHQCGGLFRLVHFWYCLAVPGTDVPVKPVADHYMISRRIGSELLALVLVVNGT